MGADILHETDDKLIIQDGSSSEELFEPNVLNIKSFKENIAVPLSLFSDSHPTALTARSSSAGRIYGQTCFVAE